MSLRKMGPTQAMRRSFFRLLPLATAVVVVLLLGRGQEAAGECPGGAPAVFLPNGQESGQPQEVSVAGVPVSEVGLLLSESEELRLKLERVFKRLARVSLPMAGSRFAARFPRVENTTNWAATFSPQTESCVLLSRFRI